MVYEEGVIYKLICKYFAKIWTHSSLDNTNNTEQALIVKSRDNF
jgi:hypothetical protein